MPIRDYESGDEAALGECVTQLQDIEREIYPKTADGASIAKPYVEYLVDLCRKNRGRIFVAEQGGQVVGYSAIQVWDNSEEVHEEPYEYAYISDVVVLDGYRGQGFGRALLKAAEAFAKRQSVDVLRIGALAGNDPARRLYKESGFDEHKIVLEKTI